MRDEIVEKLYENGVGNKAVGIELCNHERLLFWNPN